MFKRIYLIHILIFSGILLAACAPSVAPISEPTPAAFSTIPANTASVSGTAWQENVASADGVHDAGEPGLADVPVTPTVQPTILGTVNAQALNLGAGPSLNHRIFLKLQEGTALEITGRSENQEWLLVRLESGTQGWVYYEFVDTQVAVADLPLREAYGGAYLNPVDVSPEPGPQQASQPQKVTVSIEDNVATVHINGFIKDEKLVLKLERPDGKASVVVGKGKTNADGNASIQFEMPADWPDGEPLTSGELDLTVSSKDGKASLDLTIQYYR